MANPVHTVTEFCTILARSKLLNQAEIVALHRRWRTEIGGSDPDVESFTKFIVGDKILTEYQAALIKRGRADGFRIGEYVILERIGKGKSAGVYKAVHSSGQIVAIKVLPPSKGKDPNIVNRFTREGRLLTLLNHPSVVRAFQVGRSNGIRYIVMEHIEGESLETILERRKQMPATEAVRIIWQTLDGLQHLHDKHMVHRDFKPANLMVVPSPRTDGRDDTLNATVKILDIGIGRELFDMEDSSATQDEPLTVEGTILGTPDYLAPEQARDARTSDIRADIYSLGCVLFHLITGRPPFVETSLLTQLVRHATEKPVRFAELVRGVPQGLQAVFDKMCAKTPDERYATPAEAHDALTPFLPENAKQPVSSEVLAAYRVWLESESEVDLPPVEGQQSSLVVPPEVKAARVEEPALEFEPQADEEENRAKKARPRDREELPAPSFADHPPEPNHPRAAVPIAPAAPIPASNPVDVSPAQPVPAYSPFPPGMPPYYPAPSPVMWPGQEHEVDVDLVEPEEPAGFAPTRRDLLMLGVGGCGMLVSVVIGFGLAKLLKRRDGDGSGAGK